MSGSRTAQNARLLQDADHRARHVWQPHDPSAGTVAGNNSLDRHVTRARREMGEDKWQQLQSEWSQ